MITSNTRSAKNSATLIDHIYTNNTDDIGSSGVITYALSDHDIVYTLIKRESTKKEIESFWCRSMRNFELSTLKSELLLIDWKDFFSCTDVSIAWNIMYNNYVYTLNKLVPFVEMKVRHREDWTNASLMNLIRDRDQMKDSLKKMTINNENTVESKFKEFKELRGKVKRSVIKAKRDYIQTKLNAVKKDGKLYWTELNQLYPGKKQKGLTKQIMKLTDSNNKEISPETIQDFVNDYFTTIGQKLAEEIVLDNTDYIRSFTEQHDIPNIKKSFDPITRIELHDVIKNIDVKKSSNIHNIDSKLLKCCLLATQTHVLFLFNLMLITCKIPDEWKQACVTPIFKSGDRHKVCNYRPISVLPLMGKIFEKLLHTRIYDFLLETNFFSDNQGGFRPGMGVNDSISTFLEYV